MRSNSASPRSDGISSFWTLPPMQQVPLPALFCVVFVLFASMQLKDAGM
jgi:hypothetical protein